MKELNHYITLVVRAIYLKYITEEQSITLLSDYVESRTKKKHSHTLCLEL